MAPTVADYLLERLRAWDVQHVFAYAGDGINGILAAWGRADNKPQFVQARHEEMAAFEAVGYVTGAIGLLGTRPSYEMMRHCDTLLTVGSSFPYTQFLPGFGQARGVQIDIDGKFIGMRYPYEVNLVGDSAATLRALIPHLKRQEDHSWREAIEAGVVGWWPSMDAEADVAADPVNPMLVFRELSARLPTDAIVTADSGSSANWYARQLRFHGNVHGSLSGNLATMGPGVPYGIGAKFGHPDRPVIVFAGDGAMQMNGLAELITIKHYWEE
jgi:pyruvate dehydrogenase (quinone)